MRARRSAWALLGLGLLVLLAVVLLRGWQAGRELEAAQQRLPAVRAALAADDLPRAGRELAQVQVRTAAARRATSGPSWWLASHLPYLGRTPARVHELALAADELCRQVAPPLLRSAESLTAEHLRRGGVVDVHAVRAAEPGIARALDQVATLQRRVRQPSSAGLVPAVARAGARFEDELGQLHDTLQELTTATRLLPPMLGADGPRRYFVAFQTNAESRGTGGLPGAYGLLTADRGRVRFTRVASDVDLIDLPLARLDLGPDYQALYGEDARLFQNANLSPHFPYAAQLWLDMWQQRTGQRLDGVLATDPVALSSVLRALGPVHLADGEAVTADNVVPLTENAVYARFPDAEARKTYLVSLAMAVIDRLLQAGGDELARTARDLRPVVHESRLLVYSAHAREQALLSATPLAGIVPTGPGPYAGLVVNNAGGNKLDYYLERSLTYQLRGCADGWRRSTVTVQLKNGAPSDTLPSYVVGRADRKAGAASASSHLLVSLFAATGAGLDGAYVDGRRVAVLARRERGHPVFLLDLELARGQTRSLVFQLTEPRSDATPRVPVQPLVLPQRTVVSAQTCRIG